jgi:ribose transport system permease protein
VLAERLAPRRVSAVYFWILCMVLFTILKGSVFLSTSTIRLTFAEGAVTAVLAMAFLIPLAADTYDLAIGANLGLSLVISTYLSVHTGIPAWAGALIAIAACGLVGAVSGLIIVKLRVNSFIATLGISEVVTAIALFISKNAQIIGNYPQWYQNLGLNNLGGIPIIVLFMLLVALILWFILEQTTVGRYLYATGANREAARLSGVHTDRLIWGSLVASGLLAGVAGVMYSMRLGVFSNDVGAGQLFPAITAVFFGASQFSQRPNVPGTLIAYFALAFGIEGLSLVSGTADYWAQPLFEGAALVFAVALASRPVVRRRRAARSGTALPAGAGSAGASVPSTSDSSD